MRNDYPASSLSSSSNQLEVWVARTVVDAIKTLTASSPHVENGGILLGPPHEAKIIVTQATGPGPNAVRRRGSFLRDTAYCQAILNDAHQRFGWDYVGEWHSHVVQLRRPSRGDLETLIGIVSDTDYEFQHFLMLLATLDGTNVSLTSYVASRSGIMSITVRIFEQIEEVGSTVM